MSIIVEPSCAPLAGSGLTLLPRARGRRGWGPIDLEAAIGVVVGVPAPRLLLSPAPEADPGSAPVADVARASGAELVRVPADRRLHPLVVDLADRWAREGVDQLVLRLRTIASALARPCTAQILAGLGPRTLTAWSRRAACPCGWCRTGHGHAGSTCGRCGAPVR
jgi:hypothetical protein